jgi:hypothetical protein
MTRVAAEKWAGVVAGPGILLDSGSGDEASTDSDRACMVLRGPPLCTAPVRV